MLNIVSQKCRLPYLHENKKRMSVFTIDFHLFENWKVWYESVSRSYIFDDVEDFIVSSWFLQTKHFQNRFKL